MRRSVRTFVLILWWALAACAVLPSGHAAAPSFVGHVRRVADADTLVVERPDGQSVKVRLRYVDAPEVAHNRRQQDQPGARDALGYVDRNWRGREVTVTPSGESYGRIVGTVTRQQNGKEIDLGATLVHYGLAWVDERFKPPKQLLEEQAAAKKDKRGVWKNEDAIAPWLWRQNQREEIQRLRRGKGALLGPPPLQPTANNFGRQPCFFRPFSECHGSAVQGKQSRRPFVSCLLLFGCPTHIARFVISVIVDTVDGMFSRWRGADIFQKIRKPGGTDPSIAHHNPTATIELVVARRWASTASQHPIISCPLLLESRKSGPPSQTPAAPLIKIAQGISISDKDLTTRAFTFPCRVFAVFLNQLLHSQFSKYAACQIHEISISRVTPATNSWLSCFQCVAPDVFSGTAIANATPISLVSAVNVRKTNNGKTSKTSAGKVDEPIAAILQSGIHATIIPQPVPPWQWRKNVRERRR